MRRTYSCALSFVTTLFLATAAAQGTPAQALQSTLEGTSPEGNRYSMGVTPRRPAVGDLAVVELELEDVSASSAAISELRLDPGLKLEAESLRPSVDGRAPSQRTHFRFELRVLEQGEQKIEALSIRAEGKTIGLGPLVVCAGAPPSPAGNGAAAWRWVAPTEVYRYEAFDLRLEPIEGGAKGGISASSVSDAAAVFSLPVGASIEASGRLSWTVIAFEVGDLRLPEATIGSGPDAGKAKSTKVRIRPLPPEFAATRAIGRFTLALAENDYSGLVAGSALRLSLVLEGEGNLPAVILPEPDIRLNGALLPRGAWTSSRVDEVKPKRGGYAGRAILAFDIIPPREGVLSLSFSPLPVLTPSSDPSSQRTRFLSLAAREIRVKTISPAVATPSRAPLVWGPSLGVAAAAWNRGEKGRTLAQLYGTIRRAPPLSTEVSDARKAALACAALLGTGAPLLDVLPPPQYFLIAASIVALICAYLFIFQKVRGHSSRARGKAIVLLALALTLSLLASVSASERREKFAVIWADSLRTVPSAQSELSVSIVKGSTGRMRGFAGSYAGLVLADGVEGWAPLDSLFWY